MSECGGKSPNTGLQARNSQISGIRGLYKLSSVPSPLPHFLSAWRSHSGYYNCSKYEEDGEPTEVNKARKALEKYLFYYQRVGGGTEGERGGMT